MFRSVKISLYALASLVVLALLLVAAGVVFLKLDALKPRIEAQASEALGMDVHIQGRVGVGFTDLRLTLGDVRVRNHDTEVADAKEVRLDIGLSALFHDDLRVHEVRIKRANVSIVRDADGVLNTETPTKKTHSDALNAFTLSTFSILDSTFRYTDNASNNQYEAVDCDVNGEHLQIIAGRRSELLKKFIVAANVKCAAVKVADVGATDVKIHVSSKNGVIDLDPVSMHLFGGDGSGKARADFSKPVPAFHLKANLSKFHIEDFLVLITPSQVTHGALDFSTDVTAQGHSFSQIKQTLTGEAALHGENIKFDGGDLDQVLTRFESSQRFNLVDVGAFFFAGPMGLAVTKGFNFANVLSSSGGSTHIRTVTSEWRIEDGIATTKDVALTTDRYRVAMKGGLDFANERFNDLTVAVVDDRGCPAVKQKISGTFRQPVIERPSILTSLAGPALNILNSAKNFITNQKCSVFYAGSVPPPGKTGAAGAGNDASRESAGP